MRKTDSKTILNRAKAKPTTRVKTSLTFNSDIYEAFVSSCDKNEVAVSRLLEELMRDYLENEKPGR